jgi:hypothetical protein
VARTTLYTRTVLWVTALICCALAVFSASEAWLSYHLAARIQQTQAENAHLQHDALITTRRAAWAESPEAIEDAARALGYARPGEHPVVIVVASHTAAAPPASASSPGPVAGASASRDPWHLILRG